MYLEKKAVSLIVVVLTCLLVVSCDTNNAAKKKTPNFLFIFVDDLRYDYLGYNGGQGVTPNIDRIANSGLVFNQAFAVLSVCSPSRASVLTGRYPSAHGVTTHGNTPIQSGNPSFVHELRNEGYFTSVVGKWHLGNTPNELGFIDEAIFHGNGKWFNRTISVNGQKGKATEFIETWAADQTIKRIEQARKLDKPFFIWHNTQVPHMTSDFKWPASDESLSHYSTDQFTLPSSYPPNHALTGKPKYLKTSRSFTKAMNEYGYRNESNLREHIRDYHAATTDMDRELGRILDYIKKLHIEENTYVIFMSDNGWLLGEHGLTSKVLAYDKSMKVPLAISGPNISPGQSNSIISNIDLAPTILNLASIDSKINFHGQDGSQLLDDPKREIRDSLYYESPTPQLIPKAFDAVRDKNYLYIETFSNSGELEASELYDMRQDLSSLKNLVHEDPNHPEINKYQAKLQQQRSQFSTRK